MMKNIIHRSGANVIIDTNVLSAANRTILPCGLSSLLTVKWLPPDSEGMKKKTFVWVRPQERHLTEQKILFSTKNHNHFITITSDFSTPP